MRNASFSFHIKYAQGDRIAGREDRTISPPSGEERCPVPGGIELSKIQN